MYRGFRKGLKLLSRAQGNLIGAICPWGSGKALKTHGKCFRRNYKHLKNKPENGDEPPKKLTFYCREKGLEG